jgi:LPXTG-motif cell wall-anchored protein
VIDSGDTNHADSYVRADNAGSKITVTGSVTFAGRGSNVYSEAGGEVNISGNVSFAGENSRVEVCDDGSAVNIGGNVSFAGADSYVKAQSSGKINISGSVTANANANTNGWWFVGAFDSAELAVGSIETTTYEAVRTDGGEVVVNGNIVAGTKGVYIENSGEVIVNGTITASTYIDLDGVVKTPADITLPTTKAGYNTYTEGTCTVWVKGNAPTITTAFLPSGAVGTAYSQTLAATGGTPITWTTDGPLPGGLSLSAAGVISGTPTATGTFKFTVKATNDKGDDTKELSIVITAAGHVHKPGTAWQKDAAGHWNECTCGDRYSLAAHTPGAWIVDRAATATTDGSRHRDCTVCGHTETGIIPATGNQKDNDPDDSQTGGDNTILWILLGGAALVIIGGAFFFGRKWRGAVK